MDLSIIIVNWNSRKYLETCLASLDKDAQGLTFEVVVIDSGSFDGCEEMLRERYPGVRFIQSPYNIGFARANNRAVRDSVGECVLFLNPDTEVVGTAIADLHAAFMATPDAGVMGAKLIGSDGSWQPSCVRVLPTLANRVFDCDLLRRLWPACPLLGAPIVSSGGAGVREVDAVSGACAMVRRTTFERIGGFSEDYFMYAEDMDLSYKMRLAGYRNYWVPGIEVIHYGGSSSQEAGAGFAAAMTREATWRFFLKTRGRTYGRAYRAAMFLSALVRLAILVLAAPLGTRPTWRTRLRRAAGKWMAILRWSVGRSPLVRRYYGQSPALR